MQLPELLPVVLMGFTLPAMLLLLADRFDPLVALALGLLCAAGGVAVLLGRSSTSPVERSEVVWALVALAIVVAWVAVNSVWSAQDLYVVRDPATYGLSGRWLADHASIRIPTQADIFGNGADLLPASAGFGTAPHIELYAQGNHGLPVLLAMAYKLGGAQLMLRMNVVIGGLGLLALFAVARRVVPGWLACTGVVALGVSLPMLFVSRDTYSEPLSMVFLIGSIALFQRAVRSGRIVDYVFTGLLAGSSAIARIDSYAGLLGLIVAAGLMSALAAPGTRRAVVVRAVSMLAAAVPPTVIGLRDAQVLSSGYYWSQRAALLSLGKAAIALLALAVIATAVAWARPVRRFIESPGLRRGVGVVLPATAIAAFLFFLSRPWWMTDRDPHAPDSTRSYIATLQQAFGLRLDPTRTYDEHTLYWLAWNHGWPLVVLGGAGYAVLMRHLVVRGRAEVLLLVSMGTAMSMLYLWHSNIVPDQTWAMRRYMPVITPCLVVAALVAVAELAAAIARRDGRGRRIAGSVVAAGLAASLAVVPAVIAGPMFAVREDVPLLAFVMKVCDALPANAAVVLLDDQAQSGYEQTMRSWCKVPSTGITAPTPVRLAQIRQAAAEHGYVLYAFALDDSAVPLAPGEQMRTFYSVIPSRWPALVEQVPKQRNLYEQRAFLGPVRPDGRVQTLPPG